mmetsp:Transcript_31460/g.105918  ORF Transcript_31460/g.105918 Transcript_31460/m.105918 type:complete len:204 (+) Transcript_31460:202-813(+)
MRLVGERLLVPPRALWAAAAYPLVYQRPRAGAVRDSLPAAGADAHLRDCIQGRRPRQHQPTPQQAARPATPAGGHAELEAAHGLDRLATRLVRPPRYLHRHRGRRLGMVRRLECVGGRGDVVRRVCKKWQDHGRGFIQQRPPRRAAALAGVPGEPPRAAFAPQPPCRRHPDVGLETAAAAHSGFIFKPFFRMHPVRNWGHAVP